jgi:hypothetical protein
VCVCVCVCVCVWRTKKTKTVFHGCGSFQREHVATGSLSDEESVAALFDRSVHGWWDDLSDDDLLL